MSAHGWFTAPAPIRSLFSHFPLVTLPAEPLPGPRTSRTKPTLYVFASPDDVLHDRQSFNPTCLKWQLLLRIAGADVKLCASNNHASPSGALPFLISNASSNSLPLTGEKIGHYAEANSKNGFKFAPSSKSDAYTALILQNIRPALLYSLYILPANQPLLDRLYLPKSILVIPQRKALRDAATAEILKQTRRTAGIDYDQLLADANSALLALSAKLGDHRYFSETETPDILDAELFSYLHIIMDESLGWVDDRLSQLVPRFSNLVAHRHHLLERYWGEKP